jgi:hypothetical protein
MMLFMNATPSSPQQVLAPRGEIPELAGPLDEQGDGSCLPAAPDTRPRLRTMPVSSALIDEQNRALLARKARNDAIDERVRKVVAAELAKGAPA